MTEHDFTEVAYKRGYTQVVKDIFEKIDSVLNVDISHSYMSDNFILSQSKYTQIKKSFLGESANPIGTQNKRDYKKIVEEILHPEMNLPKTKYKNLDDFREKHCMMCGSQSCAGPNDEFADGCNYLKVAVFEDGSKPI